MGRREGEMVERKKGEGRRGGRERGRNEVIATSSTTPSPPSPSLRPESLCQAVEMVIAASAAAALPSLALPARVSAFFLSFRLLPPFSLCFLSPPPSPLSFILSLSLNPHPSSIFFSLSSRCHCIPHTVIPSSSEETFGSLVFPPCPLLSQQRPLPRSHSFAYQTSVSLPLASPLDSEEDPWRACYHCCRGNRENDINRVGNVMKMSKPLKIIE